MRIYIVHMELTYQTNETGDASDEFAQRFTSGLRVHWDRLYYRVATLDDLAAALNEEIVHHCTSMASVDIQAVFSETVTSLKPVFDASQWSGAGGLHEDEKAVYAYIQGGDERPWHFHFDGTKVAGMSVQMSFLS